MERSGRGLHTGCVGRVRLLSAGFGSGVTFLVGGKRVVAGPDTAVADAGCTRIGEGATSVTTPEHLLAALHGLGVTDADVEVHGPEVPALDGSAAGWVEALDEAGWAEGPTLLPRSLPALRVEAAGGWATCGPGPDVLSVDVDFGEGGPTGSCSVPRTPEAFRREVAWARTFVLVGDVERLRAAGRGMGANEANTLIWPTGLPRSADEPVRHKLLDAWGDLALLGPFSGRVHVVRGSHALHHALLGAISEAGAG